MEQGLGSLESLKQITRLDIPARFRRPGSIGFTVPSDAAEIWPDNRNLTQDAARL